VCDYLKQKGFLWIDKLHPWANDSMSASYYDPEISLKLSSDFDINLILRHVDVVITDYSTLSYKAIYFDRPLIYYWPDHEKYMKKDKGLVKEFENDIACLITYEPSELMMALNKCLGDNYMEQWADKYAVIKENVFGGRISEYEDIARDLFECIKTKW
jgi:CDP-glycerol glycerophosphotransferase (TagB/SpsB family)